VARNPIGSAFQCSIWLKLAVRAPADAAAAIYPPPPPRNYSLARL
jgi:hypothetical protein